MASDPSDVKLELESRRLITGTNSSVLTTEGKDQKRKKDLVRTFIKNARIRSHTLKAAVERYRSLKRTPVQPSQLNYPDFCCVFDLDILHDATEVIFKGFSVKVEVPGSISAYMIDVQDFLTKLIVSFGGKMGMDERVTLLYLIYQTDRVSNRRLKKDSLGKLLLAASFAANMADVARPLQFITSRAVNAEEGIGAPELVTILRESPELIPGLHINENNRIT